MTRTVAIFDLKMRQLAFLASVLPLIPLVELCLQCSPDLFREGWKGGK